MNKTLRHLLLATLCLTVTMPMTGFCDDNTNGETTEELLGDLKLYLYNLGLNTGYNLSNAGPTPPVNTLLVSPSTDDTNLITLAKSVFLGIFASTPVNSSLTDATLSNFVPPADASTNNSLVNTLTTQINNLANATFSPSTSTSGQEPALTWQNPNVDQTPKQKDPVSQSIINLLNTPDYTWCMDTALTTWTGGTSQTNSYPQCQYLYEGQILGSVLGFNPSSTSSPTLFPGLNSLFINGASSSTDLNAEEKMINDLNGNSLIAPVLYTTKNNNSNSTSSSSATSSSSTGFPGSTQAEQAANFIRYASGSVNPLQLVTYSDYNTMVSTANTAINSSTTSTQLTTILNAQKTISNYLANLRVYAAQTSVAVGNLYYILSKRLPQQDATNQNTTSQALNELTMASRRLYNPNSGNTAQWLDMINNASPSTVQKEMAILLSEINYQLYLNRQQEERLLLTNSILLIQALKQNAPTADFSAKQ